MGARKGIDLNRIAKAPNSRIQNPVPEQHIMSFMKLLFITTFLFTKTLPIWKYRKGIFGQSYIEIGYQEVKEKC